MTGSAALRQHLAGQLDGIADPAWLRAVADVPREAFVGDRYYQDAIGEDGTSLWRPVLRDGQDDSAWLSAVYADETLVTQVSGRYQEPGDTTPLPGWPTSSSTLPSLVVRMLEDLQVADDMSVLEIGTGTGYSTGLLCHRLGQERVTSVEVDPPVAARASAALGRAGYYPRLVTGDGLHGHPPGAPYDRIIATCSVRAIPWPWLGQASDGAVIVTAMMGWLIGSALARLTVAGGSSATGGFLPGTVSFMAARAHAAPIRRLHLPAWPDATTTAMGADILDDWTERWVAQLAAPEAMWARLPSGTDPARADTVLYDSRASYVRLTHAGDGTWTAAQAGPERIWDRIQDAIGAYRAAGSPPQHEFLLTIRGGRQVISHPGIGQAWDLPAGR